MPPTTSGSCATSRCAAFFAFSAESPASIATSSSLAPPIDLMPPDALISPTAVSAPHLTSVPWRAQGPLNGQMTAIFTGFACARSMRHGIVDAVASVAAPSAPCLMSVRRVVMSSSSGFVIPLYFDDSLHWSHFLRRTAAHPGSSPGQAFAGKCSADPKLLAHLLLEPQPMSRPLGRGDEAALDVERIDPQVVQQLHDFRPDAVRDRGEQVHAQ